MDVVCERCKTEYEFDDALVSERGTTVKCTNCGHQFKIYRAATDMEPARAWSLRRPDGTVIPFDSLAALQKWILEGRVSKMDEISRTGEPWKPLGAIAELDSFFATAELRAPQGSALRGTSRPPSVTSVVRSLSPAGVPSLPRSVAPRAPTPMALSGGTIRPGYPGSTTAGMSAVTSSAATSQGTSVGLPPIPPMPPTPAAPQPRLPTPIRGTSSRPSALPPARTIQIPPPPRLPTDPGLRQGPAPGWMAHADALSTADTYAVGATNTGSDGEGFSLGDVGTQARTPSDRPDRPRPAIGPPRVPTATSDAPPSRDSSNDDDDSVTDTFAPRRSNVGSMVLGLALGLIVAGGATYGAWKAGLLGRPHTVVATVPQEIHLPSPAAPFVVQAVQTARVRTSRAYGDAIEELTRAITLDGMYVQAVAARAEVQAAWCEMLRHDADDLDARATLGGSDAATARAQSTLLRRESDDHADRSRTDQQIAERGLDTLPAPERTETTAMLGDVARVLGDHATAQRHFDDVRRQSGVLSPEAMLYVVLFDRDNGTDAEVVPRLRAVIAQAGDMDRARVALARALAAAGDATGARSQLDAVLAAHPGHDDMALLITALAHDEPPMRAGTGTTVSAHDGVADAGVALADAGMVVARTHPTGTGEGVHEATEEGGGSYDDLVADGERLQNDGRVGLAREKFNRALAQRPTGAEALTGLGYVALDDHDTSGAIANFRQALANNRSYSEAYIGLGEAYSSQGNYAQALDAYNRYLEVNPSGSRASMAHRQVESLQDRIQNSNAGGGTGGGSQEAPGTATPTPAPSEVPAAGEGNNPPSGSHTTESPGPAADGAGN